MSKTEILEEKNAKLRQEIINMARERNDAESYAKDKIFMSNVKSQKIKVLKDQLKKKGKKKINVENVPENTKDLKDDDIMSKLSKVKSHKILNKFDGDKPRRSIMKNIKGSDSEISDINEDEYMEGLFERDSQQDDSKVVLPKIMNRTANAPTSPTDNDKISKRNRKTDVYRSVINLNKPDELDIDIDDLA